MITNKKKIMQKAALKFIYFGKVLFYGNLKLQCKFKVWIGMCVALKSKAYFFKFFLLMFFSLPILCSIQLSWQKQASVYRRICKDPSVDWIVQFLRIIFLFLSKLESLLGFRLKQDLLDKVSGTAVQDCTFRKDGCKVCSRVI